MKTGKARIRVTEPTKADHENIGARKSPIPGAREVSTEVATDVAVMIRPPAMTMVPNT